MNCMFSGEETSNEEHVLPRWMQKRFNLENQTYHLPNGTTIPYKHAKIPVSNKHNDRFGRIENRISRRAATLQEIYLWAFKIHIGLIHRNSTLKIDVRSPSSPTFWELDGFDREIWLFRSLYSVWEKGGEISPDPFGTVLRTKALTPQPSFDFIHDMRAGTLFFQLGDEILFIALYDQARAARSNMATQLEYHRQVISQAPAHERQDYALSGQRVWACESAYLLYRSRQGISFASTETSFLAIPPLSWAPTRPSDEAELGAFCRSFGLKLMRFGGEAGHRFASLTEDDIQALRLSTEI